MRLTSFYKISGISLLLAGIAGPAAAQVLSTRENAPYSRYGIGEIFSGTSVAQRGAGGVATAVSQPFSINTDNPASYGGLSMTTYELGAMGSRRSVVSGTRNYPTGTATLSYLRLAFPVAKGFGIALGLQPESRTYYHLVDTGNFSGMGLAINEYVGSGGLNQAFLGAGGGYKGFRVGFNLGYTFGTFNTFRNRYFPEIDSSRTFGAAYERRVSVGGLTYKLGAQYTTQLSGLLGIRVGATASLQQNLKAETDELSTSYRTSGTAGTLRDTVFFRNGAKGDMTLPLSYNAGAQLFYGNQWAVMADFSATQWKDYRLLGVRDSLADQSWKISVGAEYTPLNTVSAKYLQRVTYRLGFLYGTDPYFVGGAQPSTFMGTAGLSLPFRRTTDRIHLALEVGRRTSAASFGLKENFTRFLVGISLNDRWFVKRRYD